MNICMPRKKPLIRPRVVGILAMFSILVWPCISWSAPVVEVMHWMYRGSDARSIQVLKDEFESRGGVWHDVINQRPVDTLNEAVSRMAKGYAPTLTQWNSAWEVAQIRNLGLLNNLDEDLSGSIRQRLIANVLDMVSVDEEIVAIPVNVHSENWLWYQTRDPESVPVDIFTEWKKFLSYAEKLKSEDRVALAVGDEPWQIRTLFNSVLLGVAGQKNFEKIYFDLDASVLGNKETLNALKTFSEIPTYSRSFGDGRWDQQVAAVAANRAMALVTGDWAKGEFKKIGLKLGRDFQCAPAPGTAGNIVLVIDMFVFGQVLSVEEKRGQKLFVDVVVDPAVNETFNYLKGSLPTLNDIDVNELDSCNQLAYSTLNKPGQAIKPHANVGDRGLIATLDNLIVKLWKAELSIDEWVLEFSKVIDAEKSKRLFHVSGYAVSGE